MTAAAWHPDPTGKHELRYWDGSQWTEHVSDGGNVSADPLQPPAQAHAEEAQQAEQPAADERAAERPADEAMGEASPMSDSPMDRTMLAGDPLTDPMPQESAEAPAEEMAADEPAAETPAADEQSADPYLATQVVPQVGEPAQDAPSYGDTPPAYEPAQPPAQEGAPPAYGAGPPAYSPGQQQFPAQDPYAHQQAGPAAQPHAGQPAAGGPSPYGDAFGGITGDLIDGRFSEVGDLPGPSLQNSRLLKVRVAEPFMARQGAMVAYQGNVNFAYQGGGAAKFLKKAVTGEGLSLMRVDGQGDVFLAERATKVHILRLDNTGLSINSKNILAFSASLQWNIERVKGGSIVAGGLFNTTLRGSGWVAITTDGDPVVLNAQEAQTFADANALVAWSIHLQTGIKSTFTAGSLIGRGSGEAFQVTFSGPGFVIVQPSEGFIAPPTA